MPAKNTCENAKTTIMERDHSVSPAIVMKLAELSEGSVTSDSVNRKHISLKTSQSLQIATCSIKTPAFSYACLEFISHPPTRIPLDDLIVRSYLTSAFTQFLGLTGSAIPVDILRVDSRECWIRVPYEDLSTMLAALGGWASRGDDEGKGSWRVRGSGNWLGSLVGARSAEKVWTD